MVQYIITIVMGTIIGYGTNYLAVKMLFRPRNEVKVFGKTLPFTPGVIPKQKPQLAKAVGKAVGKKLLTKEDIKEKLTSGELKSLVTSKITDVLSTELKTEIMNIAKLDGEGYDKMKAKLSAAITGQLMKSVNSVGVGKRISDETSKALMDKVSGNMLKYVVSEEMVKTFTDHVGKEVQKYVDENGAGIIRAEVDNRLNELEGNAVTELLEKVDITEEKLVSVIGTVYDKLIDKAADELLGRIEIAKMVEGKINEMDLDSLEQLVLGVMKSQLDMIVNLGALIGFVLAVINACINALFAK